MSDLKLIWKPEVFLVGVQAVREDELGRFLASRGVDGWTTDAPSAAETLVEVAGRNCYQSWNNPRPGGNAAYIGHILESRHGSVTEHAVFNFILTGISRSLSHELIRHRVGWGYSQLSQRFVDSSDVAFVVPPALIKEADPEPAVRCLGGWGYDWIDIMERCRSLYHDLSEALLKEMADIPDKTARRKAAREAARSVLPSAAETVVFATGNARAIRNMLEQRGSLGADAEFRRLACEVARVMRRECPNLFGDVRIVGTGEEIGMVSVEHSKV